MAHVSPDPAYAATLERLFALVRFGEKLGLESPRALNRALGDPLAALPGVLIGGTNGKGSTAAFLEALLRGRGYRTGLFTSPHLMSFCERIRIDGADLDPGRVPDLAERALAAAARVGGEVPFFEVVWGMAAVAFAEAGVDFAIWEVGLGGRLDATNACEPLASAVVTVGLDHTAVLGPDLGSIAREKAAIFRPGRPAFTAARGEALVALERAAGRHVQAIGRDLPQGPEGLPLPGAHQRDNAGVALALAAALGVESEVADLQRVRWPGRAEVILPGLVLDCAHNPDSAAALAAWLAPRRYDLIVGVMADKDAAGVLGPLLPGARRVTCVTPDHPRARTAASLAELCRGVETRVVPSVAEAMAARDPQALSVLAGSCYLVGEARAHLMGRPFPEAGLRTVAR